ncbi:MAG: hypothetical protein JSS43_33050 [Proteobacteria bacterium]|nr:hypothetical protein [Pseudomonadota bacterium]
MSHVTAAELVEIVPHLRAMAAAEASSTVRAALLRLADRYEASDFDTAFARAEAHASGV